MKKPPEVLLAHMLESTERIEIYAKGVTKREFLEDTKTQDAVIRQLEIMGEAARHIAADAMEDSPIPVKAIVGMRNLLIHDYLGVDLEIVWKTVKEDVPRLKAYLQKKIKSGQSSRSKKS
jgi:uncharacterized protein with HEPN domain